MEVGMAVAELKILAALVLQAVGLQTFGLAGPPYLIVLS
jgi:hypothetical protein